MICRMVPVRRRWVVASFGLAVTLGAGAGAVYLLAGALGHPFPADHRQLHGHTQVFGFAGLLALGLVEATLPRALGLVPRAMPRPAFWLLLSAVLLRNLGQPFGDLPLGRLAVFLSAALLAAGCIPVFDYVGALIGESRPRLGSGSLTLASGATAGYLALAVTVNALQALWIAKGNGAELPWELSAAFADAALYGLLLAAGFTLGLRLAPAAGRPEVRHPVVAAALLVQALGVALALASFLPALPESARPPLRDSGHLLVAAAVLLYLQATGLASGRGTRPVAEPALRASDTAIRIAFSFLGLWAFVLAGVVATARLSELPARNPWWEDATRHLFSIGFVTLLAVGASGRLAPRIFGRPLVSPRLQAAAVALVVAGTLLRLLEIPALFRPALYPVAATSGFPVLVALGMLAWNLRATVGATAPPS